MVEGMRTEGELARRNSQFSLHENVAFTSQRGYTHRWRTQHNTVERSREELGSSPRAHSEINWRRSGPLWPAHAAQPQRWRHGQVAPIKKAEDPRGGFAARARRGGAQGGAGAEARQAGERQAGEGGGAKFNTAGPTVPERAKVETGCCSGAASAASLSALRLSSASLSAAALAAAIAFAPASAAVTKELKPEGASGT